MTNKHKKVPELRFKGFTDDWEQRKLGEVSDKVKEKNKSGKIKETLTNSAEYGIISQRDFFDKEISNSKSLDSYYLVKNNDFVYNPRISNFAPVGPIKRNKLGRTGVMSPLYYVFRTKNIDKNFLEKYFETSYWNRFMKLNGDSGARADRFAIKDSVFTEMPIPYPLLAEQEKIGQFFIVLNNTIALHQRKLDLLKEQKKGFLQKMFPKNGEIVPELRFEGFAEAWEQRKFGDVWAKSSERNTNLEYSPDKVISVAQMKLNPSERDSTDEYMKTYNILHKGDIAFEGNKSKHFAFGRFVLNDIQDGIVSHVFNVYRPKVEMDIDFMKIYINNENVMRHILVRSTTKTLMMTTLNTKDIVKQHLHIPMIQEQKKIGKLFSNLDHLITLHQRKLDLLKEQKKGFLQKMFV